MDFLILLFSRLPSCFGHLSTNHDCVRNAVHVPRVDSADHQLVPPAGLPGQQDRHLWFLHWPLPCPAVLHRQLGMGGVHHRRQNCGVHYTGELVDWGWGGVGWGWVGGVHHRRQNWHSLYGWVSRLGVWWGGVGWGGVGLEEFTTVGKTGIHYTGELVDWGWGGVGWIGVGGVHHCRQNCGVHYMGELVDWGWGGVGCSGMGGVHHFWQNWRSLYGRVSRLGVG